MLMACNWYIYSMAKLFHRVSVRLANDRRLISSVNVVGFAKITNIPNQPKQTHERTNKE